MRIFEGVCDRPRRPKTGNCVVARYIISWQPRGSLAFSSKLRRPRASRENQTDKTSLIIITVTTACYSRCVGSVPLTVIFTRWTPHRAAPSPEYPLSPPATSARCRHIPENKWFGKHQFSRYPSLSTKINQLPSPSSPGAGCVQSNI